MKLHHLKSSVGFLVEHRMLLPTAPGLRTRVFFIDDTAIRAETHGGSVAAPLARDGETFVDLWAATGPMEPATWNGATIPTSIAMVQTGAHQEGAVVLILPADLPTPEDMAGLERLVAAGAVGELVLPRPLQVLASTRKIRVQTEEAVVVMARPIRVQASPPALILLPVESALPELEAGATPALPEHG